MASHLSISVFLFFFFRDILLRLEIKNMKEQRHSVTIVNVIHRKPPLLINRFLHILTVSLVWANGPLSIFSPIVQKVSTESRDNVYSLVRHYWKPPIIVQLFNWVVTKSSTILYRYTFNAANLVSRLLIHWLLTDPTRGRSTSWQVQSRWLEVSLRRQAKLYVFCFDFKHKETWNGAEYFAYLVHFFRVVWKLHQVKT